ncbi:unnamed protein product [Vitrella brassicaformis CCMP3155]|uniref:Pseudouridine synthase RsuA/RluA-like domain-containing protein n=1 Tax=Vitrella brassicaformis (strain CCMP3155) TaxID=1169540 RepID=A0A0G4H7R1_VITBC|nr:unnamed protein product [Vitrella brassicaformis CCMP3155]|eukprot:CEM39954.1 unnamed protein product [Vitrella brassicaformis CCMP3155]
MPNSVDLSILHEDNAVIAVNKPSGLLSVPGRVIKDSVATRVSRHVKADRVDKLICHRLDQMTSGVMLFAKTDEAQRDIYEQFRKKKVRKRYAAVVDGLTHCCEGEIRLPLVKDYANPPTSRVDWRLPSDDDNRADTSAPAGVKTAKSKRSITLWRVLRIFPDINASLLELTPITGRSHQLRVHLSAIGHPILGDDFYAPREAADRAPRLMLHAHTLELTHPVTTAPLHLCADATDIAEWLRGHACCDG